MDFAVGRRQTLIDRARVKSGPRRGQRRLARYAESLGHFEGAETFWRMARHYRVEGLKLRALAEARRSDEPL